MHPLIKLGWLIFLTAVTFIIKDAVWMLFLVLFVIAMFPGAGLTYKRIPGKKIIALTALMIAVLQILFVSEGAILFEIGPVTFTVTGLNRGVFYAGRFLSVIGLSYLFVFTTSPNELAYALMQAGFPYRFGFTLVTALRLIPIFQQEITTVYQAQQVRGISYRKNSLRGLIHRLRSMLLPMLVSAMSKVDSLAVSMEGRSFGKYSTRTFYSRREMSQIDWAAGGALLLMLITLVFYSGRFFHGR